jgi:hypothetical protein
MHHEQGHYGDDGAASNQSPESNAGPRSKQSDEPNQAGSGCCTEKTTARLGESQCRHSNRSACAGPNSHPSRRPPSERNERNNGERYRPDTRGEWVWLAKTPVGTHEAAPLETGWPLGNRNLYPCPYARCHRTDD